MHSIAFKKLFACTIILSVLGACTPLRTNDEKTWNGNWKYGNYYAPPETDL